MLPYILSLTKGRLRAALCEIPTSVVFSPGRAKKPQIKKSKNHAAAGFNPS